MAVTVRISGKSHKALAELAQKEGRSLQATLDEAIESLRRRRILTETNHAFAALRADSRAWREEEVEREAWSATLADGQETP
ncbi:MAG: toxin-antitoxin system protein [Acidobacteriota bacterium]